MYRKLVVIILYLVVNFSFLNSQNLISNPDFENGIVSPWYAAASCSFEVETNNPHTGIYCAKVSNRTEYYHGPKQHIESIIVPGTYYKFSAWVREYGEPESDISMMISQNDDDGTNYYKLNVQSVTEGNWVQLVGHFQLEVDGTLNSLKLYFQGPPSGVELFLDDVIVEEVDYDWLSVANSGIELNRKRDVRVRVVDKDGNPLSGASVHLKQISHNFAFGACVNDYLINNSDYRDFFISHYEWGVHESHAKWRQMESTRDNVYYGSVDGQYNICKENGIKMRGHNVFWCPDQNVPDWLPPLSNTDIKDEMIERIDDAVAHFTQDGRKMYHWDVNNEMLHGSFFKDRLGDTIRPWMFKQIHITDSLAELYVNDYNIVSGRKVHQYINQIQELLDDGAPIHGIGVQSHMHAKVNPYSLKYSLDLLSDFNLPILITEFDVELEDVNDRADRLERFFRVVFGHPKTSGIFMWGFWEDSHWKDNAHIVDSDWTLNAAGEKFEELIDEWTTDTTIVADVNGEITYRAFHGNYLIDIVPVNQVAFSANREILSGENELQINVSLPEPCSGTNWDNYQENLFDSLPTSGIEILADHFNDFSHSDYDDNATYTTVSISDQTFTEALQISIDTEPWREDRVNMTLNTPDTLFQDDIVLVSFYARTIAPSSSGSGEIEFRFMRSSDPWTKHVIWPLKISDNWKKYYIPFPIEVWRGRGSETTAPDPPDGYDDYSFAIDEVRFRFCLGYYPQTIQIADTRIVNYGPDIEGDSLPYSCLDECEESVFIKKSNGNEICTPQILADAENGLKFLPDFSYAGYHFGEVSLPSDYNGMTVLDVTDYGAVADDGNDDTQSIQDAISAAEGTSGPVILEFPSGTFILSDVIFLKRDSFIMKGAGSQTGGTILDIPKPMEEMTKPQEILDLEQEIIDNNQKTGYGEYYSPFSWTGGVIWIKNENTVPAANLATITSANVRGDFSVVVDDNSELSIGKRVELRYYQNGSSVSVREHVFNCTDSDLPDGFGSNLPPTWTGGPDAWQVVTITAINDNTITFKEPLNHDIKSEWEGQLRERAFVKEIGFEGFKIVFPDSAYAGHHIEEGYNAIYMDDVLNSWIKDISITNCDAGIMVDDSKNITVSDIEILGRGGHYSFKAGSGDQVLFKNFIVSSRTLHNPSFNTYCRTSVYTNGEIKLAMLDQHNGMNHQNLFDNLKLTGDVRRLWNHGGSDSRRPTHAAYNTSWNLKLEPDQNVAAHITDIFDGPSAYLIGLSSQAPLMFHYGPSACQQCIGKGILSDSSLYNYQLDKRLGLIISEVSDPSDNPNGRFIELYNGGPATIYFNSGEWYLSRQTNGSTWEDIQLTGLIASGETYVIAFGTDFSTFNGIYGFDPDIVSTQITDDGGDGYFLYRKGNHLSGLLVDSYGVMDIDGTGSEWEYKDTKVTRKYNIKSPKNNWDSNEWIIRSNANVADMTPDFHRKEIIWQGNTSTDWNNHDDNWNSSHNFPPDESANVIIPVVTNYPVLTGNGFCNDLIIQNGAILTINGKLTTGNDYP